MFNTQKRVLIFIDLFVLKFKKCIYFSSSQVKSLYGYILIIQRLIAISLGDFELFKMRIFEISGFEDLNYIILTNFQRFINKKITHIINMFLLFI